MNEHFEELAAELDRYAPVPDDVLLDIVTRDGACMWLYTNEEVPDWTGDDHTDREMAARICAGCPVRRECLELELRTAADATVGVWGALSEEDRRALYPVWRARRQDNGSEGDGGQSA